MPGTSPLSAWWAQRPPAAGAAVMATGIISIGLGLTGHEVLSLVFLALACAAWVALAADFVVRLLWQRQRWLAEAGTPAGLTAVAATTVLGARFAALDREFLAAALLALAAVLWPVLLALVVKHWRRRMPGAVFLACVATQGLATCTGRRPKRPSVDWRRCRTSRPARRSGWRTRSGTRAVPSPRRSTAAVASTRPATGDRRRPATGDLEGAALAERAGGRQATAVTRVRKRLRGSSSCAPPHASNWLSRGPPVRPELKRHKKTITGKLADGPAAAAPAHRRATGPAHGRGHGHGNGHAARLTSRGRGDGLTAPGGPGRGDPTPVPHRPSPTPTPSSAVRTSGVPQARRLRLLGLVQARVPFRRCRRCPGRPTRRSTRARRVARSELLPGDLVFFYSGISHVGIYVGNGQMVHAPNPSAPVRVAPIDEMPFAGATRVV
ncbi:hypothetical protein SGLAM104S_08393 [Streptomyces glaucescens]